MSKRPRYHLNVTGDFYVESDCCTMCGVPLAQAPDLFGEDAEQCYVRKQPTGSTELARMPEVVHMQELGCIRDRGRALDVIMTIHACTTRSTSSTLPAGFGRWRAPSAARSQPVSS